MQLAANISAADGSIKIDVARRALFMILKKKKRLLHFLKN